VELERFGSCTLDRDGCDTCGDSAVPVRVLKLEGQSALVEDRLGQRRTVATDFTPSVRAGDVLLVHAGVAISMPDTP
jgi:hydrogenase expression/formation protein HypC